MEYIKIEKSELMEICNTAKSLIKNANSFSANAIQNKAHNILFRAQQPLQEKDPQNI